MKSVSILALGLCTAAALGAAVAACSASDDSPAAPVPEQPAAPEPTDLRFIEEARSKLPSLPEADGLTAAVADVDGDGLADIVQPTRTGVHLLWNEGGSFEPGDGVIPPLDEGYTAVVLAGDVTGDDKPDLLLLNADAESFALLVSKGTRSFQPGSPPFKGKVRPNGGALCDIDGDGDSDVIITLEATHDAGIATPARALLLVNDGKGSFTDETAQRLMAPSLEPAGVAAGDIDGDGAPDLFFSADSSPYRLLLNDGTGVFRDAAADALPVLEAPRGRAPVMGDFDGDGFLDVFVPSATANTMLRNDGLGRLFDDSAFALGGARGTGVSATAVDLDQDTALDLVIANPDGQLVIARNDGTGRMFDYTGSVSPSLPGDSDSMSASVADFDGDGDMDVFVSRTSLSTPWLLMNRQGENLTDSDDDGSPDDLDNCPEEYNRDQANHDACHFSCCGGTACAEATGCTLALYDGDKPYLLCGAAKTWQDARSFCQALGGDLAVVASAEENDWIVGQHLDNPWLGLSDTAAEGTFQWVDGSAVSFAPWNDGEPNDSGGNEDCAGVLTSGDAAGTWNDFDCAAQHPFLCQDTSARSPADPGDACDVCPLVFDPSQEDSDNDGIGDACEPSR